MSHSTLSETSLSRQPIALVLTTKQQSNKALHTPETPNTNTKKPALANKTI